LRVEPRIRAFLGDDVEFTLEWVSVYTFACERMERFRHGRVVFVGDSAHCVSPFGARGANSGIQDADNLAWKLRLVLDRNAPERLLDSYDAERNVAADENIRHSTRSTDFITPKNHVSRVFRDAALKLARDHPFARRIVNSGRLSTPTTLHASPLNTEDVGGFAGAMRPGAPCADAPVRDANGDRWFLDNVGNTFTIVYFAGRDEARRDAISALQKAVRAPVPLQWLVVGPRHGDLGPMDGFRMIEDRDGVLADRYDAQAGTCYLIRPDQHVCARTRLVDETWIRVALARAMATDRERAGQW